ncbi:MAG: M20/M25/M40 family metallo-hydrolase, partial [Rubrivivax sp.]
ELEAVERLLADGFKPRRTVYLMFGHDEEIGGQQGAAQIAALLQQRGIKLDFVLDEGLLIISGVLPGLDVPAAAIGIAEKGSLTVKLSVPGPTGHSSMPPPPGQSAIAVLAAALARVDAQPMPGGIKGVVRQMLETVAPEMSWQYRIAMSNLWLFGPLIEPVLARSPSTNALIRTTTALTVFSAGNKGNVLPGRAEATVNFRLLPGDPQDKVLDHLRRAVADPRVKIEPEPDASEASRVASTESGAYRLVERTLREVFPDAVVVPGLMVGATDSGHFASVADQILRFSPVRANAEDLKRFHGTNERIALNNLADMVRFHHRLVQQAAQ